MNALEVVLGTHPIPQSYWDTHQALGTWSTPGWPETISGVATDEAARKRYD